MCIRDRPGLDARDHCPIETPADPDAALAHYIVMALDLAAGCLLYTSDAADERSSVDLGGRRIIKKKNTLAPSDTDVLRGNKI